MSRRFMYQGKEYSSLEELPPEARQVYEQVFKSLADNNHNGIPDLLEGMTANTLVSALNAIHLNGQNYNSVEEMPPEARRIYDKAMAAVAKWTDQDQDGIPDLLQGMAAAAGKFRFFCPPGGKVSCHRWNYGPVGQDLSHQ